jgi:translation initiation factor 2B subunit (eIF-2B alpha/beta/delta family)
LRRKIRGNGWRRILNREEVIETWPEKDLAGRCDVRNMYFEGVEGRDVDFYVTEKGLLTRDGLKDIYRQREIWQDVWKVLDL